MSNPIDVAVIGGGPAGLTAGLYAARGNARTVIFERALWGGQITTTDHVENYPAFPEGISGAQLGELMYRQATAHGAQVQQFVDITALDRLESGIFELTSEYETYQARCVILATGAVPSRLGIPGEEHYTGRGVSWCATCDAAFYRQKVVAVIGGGDAAVEEALFLTRFARHVYLVHRRDEFRATAVLVDRAHDADSLEIVTPYIPVEIKGDGSKVTALVIESATDRASRELGVDGVFEFVGVRPQNTLASELLAPDARGYIATAPDGSTTVPGLFGAGDLTKGPLKQVVTAASAGAIAGFSALHYLDARN